MDVLGTPAIRGWCVLMFQHRGMVLFALCAQREWREMQLDQVAVQILMDVLEILALLIQS
jgi:hypothetical protein